MDAMARRPTLALIFVLGVLIASCSGSGSDDDIGDFSQIAQSDPVVEVDPSGTVATLRVSTTINAVCAVVYGIDGPSGSIATDQDMGIGGHSDHNARMTNLEPGTRYQYRLQGVGVDGRIYRSDVMTFDTPASTPNAAGENVAVGASVIDVSSEFSDDFAAANALDGNLATEWSTRGDGDDAFLTIDLGRDVEVSAVGFRTRSMSDGSATTDTFSVDVDGTTYGPFAVGPTPSASQFTARVLTFNVETSSGGNTGALEIEVYSR